MNTNVRLYLFRHAKSDWSDGRLSDFDRPLNKRGKLAADGMGLWLNQQSVKPARIVSSPAARAKQTCLRVAKHLHITQDDVFWESAIYEAGLSTLIDIIENYTYDVNSLMVIGHNPGMELVVRHLGGDKVAAFESRKFFPTATVCGISLASWDHISQTGAASIDFIARPKETLKG